MNTQAEPVHAAEKPRLAVPQQLWVVGAVALVAALFMSFVGFGLLHGVVANPGDPYHYKEIALHFTEHGFDKLTRRAAMLYPHVLWLIYELGGGDLTIQLLHVAFHVATACLVFSMGQRVFNTRTGFFAGLFVAVHPMLLRYVGDFHTETMLTFMCILTVWLAIRFHDRPTVPNGLLLGAVGMLGVLTKGVLLPFLAFFSAYALYRVLRKKDMKALVPVLAIGIAAIAVWAPWGYRNYQVSGRFVPFTPGTPDAFLRGYIFTRVEFITLQRPPYVDAENESNELFRRIARENGTTWELDEVVDDDNNRRYMNQYIKDHPFLTLRKFVVGLFTFWYQMTSFKNSLVPFTLAIVCWTLAAMGFKRARKEGRPFWLLVLPIVSLNLIVAALVPLGRYSTPILPCLAILAAFGVDTLLTRRKERAASNPAPAT